MVVDTAIIASLEFLQKQWTLLLSVVRSSDTEYIVERS